MRLIDADELKKAYFNAINETSIGEVSIIDIIDNVPTVEPEITDDDLRACMKESHHLGYELAEIKYKRPQGEWILNEDENPECPFCHHSYTWFGNFCGNCGARMTSTDRDCENCVHHIDGKGCESWECEFKKRSDV